MLLVAMLSSWIHVMFLLLAGPGKTKDQYLQMEAYMETMEEEGLGLVWELIF